MEYQEATAVLCDIERNVAVERLRHDGLDIWPLLRLTLWRQLAGGAGKVGAAGPAARVVERFAKLLLAARALLRSRRAYPKADIVFFVAGDERSVVEAGKAISPFGDSLRDYAQGIGISSVTLDISRASPPYGKPFSVQPEIALASLRIRLHAAEALPATIAGFEELDGYIHRAHPYLHLDAAQLLEEIRLIVALKYEFLRILRSVSPKAVFLSCYYHPSAMGLILACRTLGIRSIDVQHGQQGDYHGMYANWTKAGPGGYALLPDNFWSWGEQSAERINKWSRPSWPAQRAVVGGNSWMARQIHQPGAPNEEAQLDKVFVAGKTHVLLALQPIEDPLPAFIQQAIVLSPPQVRWLVRLHPKMREGSEKNIGERLRSIGKGNFEMELSSSLPLSGLLKRADFVITLWSSVAYEALLFGAHPVIAHENGLKSFKSYIDRGLFSYAASSGEILGLLKRGKPARVREDAPYIETREEVIFEKLRWAAS